MSIPSVVGALFATTVSLVPAGRGVTNRPPAPMASVVVSSPGARTAARPAALEPPAPIMSRRVDIVMKDVAFLPASIEVKLGETVTFVFTNSGRIVHDAFLGDKAAQDAHEQEMRNMKDPNDHHGHEGGITVGPGETGALRHFFDKPGTFEIGCHQLGHYGYGMKAIIEVRPV